MLPIETRSLLLRQFVPDDAPAALHLSHEEAYRTWLPNQVYRDQAHALSELAFLIDQFANPGNPRHAAYVVAIEHRTHGDLISHVGFSPLDDEVEICFSIGRNYQRQRLATEAIFAASHWVLQAFNLDRIIAV